jgi:hypothetical protein
MISVTVMNALGDVDTPPDSAAERAGYPSVADALDALFGSR